MIGKWVLVATIINGSILGATTIDDLKKWQCVRIMRTLAVTQREAFCTNSETGEQIFAEPPDGDPLSP